MTSSPNEYTYQYNPEWMEDPSMPVLKVTKSSLNTFEYCRKQYEFSYLEGRKQEQTPAMLKGTVVHNSYEDFYDNFNVSTVQKMEYNEIFDYSMGLFPIDDYGELYQNMAAFETERFVKARESKLTDTFLPVGNEIRCNAKLIIPKDVNPKFTLQRDYTVHLQGIIDRIFREGDGYIPVELKTGGWKDRKAANMRNEMAFYKVLMDADPDCDMDPVTHWGWYFPAANHFQVEPVKKRNENNVVKRIAKLIYAYESGLFPTSYFYAKCQYCSFIGICDAAKAADMWTGGW